MGRSHSAAPADPTYGASVWQENSKATGKAGWLIERTHDGKRQRGRNHEPECRANFVRTRRGEIRLALFDFSKNAGDTSVAPTENQGDRSAAPTDRSCTL